jgi:hypothetical protein
MKPRNYLIKHLMRKTGAGKHKNQKRESKNKHKE